MNEQDFKLLDELVGDLESGLGNLGLNVETIKNIEIELGYISEDVSNVNERDPYEMAFTLRDIKHKIHILADLLHYTTKEMTANYEETSEIMYKMCHLIVGQPKENGGNENE